MFLSVGINFVLTQIFFNGCMYVMTTYKPTPNNIPSPEGFCVAVIFVVAVYGQILYLDATFRTKLINLDLETKKGSKESEKAFQDFFLVPR